MAKKTTRKSSTTRKRSTRSKARRAPAKKKTSAAKSRSSTRKKTASSSRSKAAPRKSTSRTKKPTRQASPQKSNQVSLDRKLDITGVILSAVGIVTLVGLLSTENGKWMGTWVRLLGQGIGWGLYILPVGLILVGFWLIFRNFQRLPGISVERVVGIFLLFVNLTTILHFIKFPPNREAAFLLASQGEGGGYLGAWINDLLRSGLGWGGTGVALFAWFLLSLALSLDVSVLELFGWVTPIWSRIRDSWIEYQGSQKEKKKEKPPVIKQPAEPKPDVQKTGEQPVDDSITILGEAPPQGWNIPVVEEILDAGKDINIDDDYDQRRAETIEETLESFGAPARVVEINRGPTITQFGVEPSFIESRGRRVRVRVGKITALQDDLALALAATRIRIQAPVPGKGYVGIEVPNEEIALVALRDIIENPAFKRLEGRTLRFALGQDVSGNAVAADLASMPHLLIAGTTGSGKSVLVNALISCLLMHNTPDDLRMIMVDPKRVELTGYDGIPHLLAPVVTDLERVIGALQWVTREMDQRYHKFAQVGSRNLIDFNKTLESKGERKLPYLVVIIDELADLMMLAPDETERTITRLAQLARATGIHLVISTQRPSVDVVTGLIKANFPARIAFAVASSVDSRVILDQPGADRLLGRGDMLFQAPDAAAPVRLQGVFVSEPELLRLVQYWRGIAGYAAPTSISTAAGGIPDGIPKGIPLKQMPMWEEMKAEEDQDPLLDEAIDLVRRRGRASISMLQRRMRIGYTRAARLVETMEDRKIISAPQPGAQFRDILDYGPAAPPADD